MDSKKKIHEAEAILIPIKVIKREKYAGCLEYRYIPQVKG